MSRIILFWIFFWVSIPTASGWTLVGHPGVKVEDGLEFLPICPQARNTPSAPDDALQLINPLSPSPENITPLRGKTLRKRLGSGTNQKSGRVFGLTPKY